MILKEKITIIETTNDIGNGRTKDNRTTVARVNNNQAR
jgi:hypothetical protein